MADYKFFNIGKANAEIVRLEAEFTKAQAEAKTARENLDEVSTSAEANVAKLTQAEADLATAKASIATMTARAEKAEADLQTSQTELTAAKATISNPAGTIQKAAAVKAAEITQAQGQPPVTVPTNANPAATAEKPGAGLKGIAKVQAAFKAQLAKDAD